MDYKEKYEAALERAKSLVGTKEIDKADFEYIFPELRESEDERIREEIRARYNDIDSCIDELLKARKNKDTEAEGKALFRMEGLMVGTLQDLSCIEDYLEKQKENPFAYDKKTYHQVKEESWNYYKLLKDKLSVEELFYKGFFGGYNFAIHEEKPHTWTKHDEAVRKEAIECLEKWGKDYHFETEIDYENILGWLKEELTVHTTDKKKEQKPTPDWMPKFLDGLRSMKHYFDYDEHRDIEGHILAIIRWIAPNYFDKKEKEKKSEYIAPWLQKFFDEYDAKVEELHPDMEEYYQLNGAMIDFIKTGKTEEEQEHRQKCYNLFWDALEDSTFFEQEEQKPGEQVDPADASWDAYYQRGLNKGYKLGFKAGRKEQKPKMTPKWLYRLEFKDSSCGLWYDGSGKWCFESGIGSIDGCKTKTLPMDYDARYKQDGRDWFSSCSQKEDLMHWYSLEDAKELISKGFVFTRYLATEYHEYDQQTVFIKETALCREQIDIFELFGQKPAEWSEGDDKTIHLACEFIRHRMSSPKDTINGIEYGELINRLKSLRPTKRGGLTGEEKEKIWDALNKTYAVDFRDKLYLRVVAAIGTSWKPSEEQMRAFEESLMSVAYTENKTILESLYEQLKKL